MKNFFAIPLVISTFGAAAGTSEQNATCVANPPIEALSATEREAVTEALKLHSEHMCASDACEFRVRKLAGGRTLVSLRAARYAKELEQCVTVYMGRAGVVFDSAGEIHDRWQYCHVVVEELKNDPTLEKELGYHRCEKPA